MFSFLYILISTSVSHYPSEIIWIFLTYNTYKEIILIILSKHLFVLQMLKTVVLL